MMAEVRVLEEMKVSQSDGRSAELPTCRQEGSCVESGATSSTQTAV